MASDGACRVFDAGDSALIVELEARVDPAINARCIAIAESIRAERFDGVRDVVPTYHTVAVYFDPLQVDGERLRRELVRVAVGAPAFPVATGRLVDVPVCYDAEFGPDLEEVASHAACGTEEVVARHGSVEYRVYMLGFVPGFAYMGIVDERIAMPRRTTPRLEVPARSVAIGSRQTAVYPIQTPGGWRLIGRTPVAPFVETRTPAFLFAPGDRVRFHPITRAEYAARLAEEGLRDG
jgi:KipI family sensor histidine kinase inhibitor